MTSLLCLCLLSGLVARAAETAAGDRIRGLIAGGRQDEARQAIADLLEPNEAESLTDEDRAVALRWLGRLEVADRNWDAALAAYEQLAGELGGTAAARDAATEIALLEAFREAGGLGMETAHAPVGGAATMTPATPELTTESEATRRTSDLESVGSTAASPARGVLIGAFGVPFGLAEETGREIHRFLEANGVVSEFEATASQALRGGDAVVAYLLERTRALGHSSLLVVRSRWGYREFVEVEHFSAAGAPLWREKVTGSRELRPKTIKPNLIERMRKKLDRHVGEPELTPQ